MRMVVVPGLDTDSIKHAVQTINMRLAAIHPTSGCHVQLQIQAQFKNCYHKVMADLCYNSLAHIHCIGLRLSVNTLAVVHEMLLLLLHMWVI